MVANLRKPELDLDLFIRPFRREAWLGITACISVILGMTVIPYFILGNYFSTHGHRLFVITGWLLFVPLEIYFGGVLTMYFTTEASFPFETVEDVIRAYPKWKLKFQKGTEYHIIKDVVNGRYMW